MAAALALFVLSGCQSFTPLDEQCTYEVLTGMCILDEKRPTDHDLVRQAVSLYARELPRLTSRECTEQDILDVIGTLVVEFLPDVFEYGDMTCSGLYWHGGLLQVAWPYPYKICRTSLFHELHHAMDEMLFGAPTDYRHADVEYWHTVDQLKDSCKEQI